jgi:hypothetical protein
MKVFFQIATLSGVLFISRSALAQQAANEGVPLRKGCRCPRRT